MDIQKICSDKYYNEIIEDKNSSVQSENQNSAVRDPIDFSKDSYVLTCPFCNNNSATRSGKKASVVLILSSFVLIAVPPCCVVPWLVSSCYDKLHFCSSCGKQVGRHKSFRKPSYFD